MKKHLITDTKFKILSADFLIGPANEHPNNKVSTLNQVFKSKKWINFKSTPFNDAPTTFSLTHKKIWIDGQQKRIDTIQFSKLNGMAKPGWMVQFQEEDRPKDAFRVMFDTIDDFLFLLDSEGNILKTNKAVEQKLNYTPSELLGMNVLQLHPAERRAEALQIVTEMLQGTRDFCPVPLLKKDGGLIPVETIVSLADLDGSKVLFGRSKDLSKLTEADKKTGLAQQKFSASFQDTRRALSIVNLSTSEITDANNTFIKRFSANSKKVIGRTATELGIFDPIRNDNFHKQLTTNGFAQQLFTIKANNNSAEKTVDIKAEVITVDNTNYALINAEDVTEKFLAEEKLKDSEMRLNLALDASETGFWDYNLLTKTININKQYSKILGYKHLSKNQLDSLMPKRCHPEDLDLLKSKYKQVLLGTVASLDIEYRLKHKSGKWIWIHSKGTVVQRDKEGNPVRLAGINVDVTQKHLTEESLNYKVQFETLLSTISRSLSNINHKEIDASISHSLQNLNAFLKAEYGLIGLINNKNNQLNIEYRTESLKTHNLTRHPQIEGIKLAWLLTQTRKRLYYNRNLNKHLIDSGLAELLPSINQINGLIAIPLMFQNQPKGVIVFASKSPISDKNDLLTDYLNNIGFAFTNAILRKELEVNKLNNQLQLEKKVKERTRELKLANDKLKQTLAQLGSKNHEIQRFKSIADVANYAVIITNPRLEPIYANSKFIKLFGKPNKIDTTLFIQPIFDPATLNVASSKFQKLNAGSETQHFESLMVTKSGVSIPMLVNAIKVKTQEGLPSYFGFTLIDLSEQKKAEADINNAMLKFRSLFNEAQDAIVITDENGKIIETNPAASKLLGYSHRKLSTFYIADIDDPTYSLTMNQRLERIKRDKRSFFETIWLTKQNVKKPVEINLSSFTLNGKTYLLNLVRDISERRKSESELRLLWAALNSSDTGIMITDQDRKITFVNPSYCNQTGFTEQELLGQLPTILASGQHNSQFYEEMDRSFAQKKMWKGRLINKKKDGQEFIDDTIISPITNLHGEITHYVALKHDATFEVKQEQEMLHKEKLASLGTLAGGIAHDFNNILQIILSYNELIETKVNETIDIKHYNETISSTCARGNKLVRSLLDFSREKSSELRPHDFKTIVATALTLIKPLYPSTIIFMDDYRTTGQVLCDPEQIQQAMLNLFNNAIDSMKGKGSITVSLLQELKQENSLLLRITDTGSGMDQATLRRVFEPFFTTKPVGKGTGFGIPIVHGIAKRHNAKLTIESEINQGTTVNLAFPLI